VARGSRQLEKRPAVDPRDEPSAEWGWHGGFPLGGQIAGWFVVAFLLAMLYGNHETLAEDLTLIAFATIVAIGLLLDIRRRRRRATWRR
jgi:hypothetical protein